MLKLEAKHERIVLFILAFIQFVHIVDFMLVMPLGPTLMKVFSIGTKEFGLIVSSYTISAGICSLIVSSTIDRFPRKKMFLFLFAGFLIGTLLCSFAPNYPFLLLTRIMTGAFGGILSALTTAMVSDFVPFERRGKAMAMIMSAFSLASIIGVPFGLFLGHQFNWQAPFLMLAILGSVAFIIGRKYIPEFKIDLTHQHNFFQTVSRLINKPNYQKCFGLTALLSFSSFSIIPFISSQLVMNCGQSEASLSSNYMVAGICTFFSTMMIGRLADNIGKAQTFFLMNTLSFIPIYWLTHIGPSSHLLIIVVMSLFMMFVSGRMMAAMTFITGVVSPQERGAFMSINACLQHLASGVASIISGMVTYVSISGSFIGLDTMGIVSIVIGLFAFYLAFALTKEEKLAH